MSKQLFDMAVKAALLGAAMGCSGSSSSDFKNGGGGVNGGAGGTNNGPLGAGFGSGTGGGGAGSGATGAVGPGGSMGVPQNCPGGGSTTISGTVYDPAMQNPLYNITVYVPKSAALPALTPGASCNTCTSLFPEILASAVTDANGHFTIPNAPWGPNLPLVVQTGKWRKEYTLANVTQCKDNPQPDKSLRLPKNAIHGDGDLPDIAISTGGADSLECLLMRIGVDTDEYAVGPAGPGHLHIFTGHAGASTMPASPDSSQTLWNATASLMKYDVLLLSCEGVETTNLDNQGRQSLVDYSAAGGRVFASHYHYYWFNVGPFANANLAQWTPGAQVLDDGPPPPTFAGNVITTLANGMTFPEGVALKQWLGTVNALTNGQLPIWFSRHNADVGPMNWPPSQPWIELDQTTPAPKATQYFSFDTPIGKTPACGRVVYSDLHVSGGPDTNGPGVPPDYPAMPSMRMRRGGGQAMAGIVPSGCATHPLTPQEKALEFMIFDLSSCLIPIGQVAMPPKGAPPR